MALHQAGLSGSSARSRRTPEEQAAEYRVLDYLAGCVVESDLGTGNDVGMARAGNGTASAVPSEILVDRALTSEGAPLVREETLRSATKAPKSLLAGMVRKKWLTREDVSAARDATRTIKIAVLKSAEGKLNNNQRILVDTLAASGGRVAATSLLSLDVPRTTLATLVRRTLVEIMEEPADFTVSRSKPRPALFDFDLNLAQQSALKLVKEVVAARKFSGMLLHGITGSGKTAVYLAAMRAVLEAGHSAILLVPEIGLTPAVAADLHQIFGDEVAILHSALLATVNGAGNSGTASSAATRAWSSVRGRQFLLQSRTSR